MSRALRVMGICLAVFAVAAVSYTAYAAVLNPPPMVGVIAAPGRAAIEATDQVGPPDEVTVGRILAPDDSWVVVYLAGAGVTSGPRVGSIRVGAGETRDLVVPLEGHVDMSQRLILVLHADRGVRGSFEFDPARFDVSPDKPYYVGGAEVRTALSKDMQVADAEGPGVTAGVSGVEAEPGSAALEVAGRIAVIDRLVVDRVAAPAASWVVVYLVGDDGKPTERVGLTRVPAGETLGVEVGIDPGQSLTEKVLVALQADLGAASVFEFDAASPGEGTDLPYSVDGVEVSTPVLIRSYGMSAGNMSGGGMGGGMSGTP